MIFLFGADKKSHPQVRYIPKWIWLFVFNAMITEEEEARMVARMRGAFSEGIFPLLPGEDPLKSLLYVASAHPECMDEELIAGARSMGVVDETVVLLGMMLGRSNLYKTEACNLPQLRDIIKKNDYLVMFLAASSRQLHLFDELVALLTPDLVWEMMVADDYRILFWNRAESDKAILEHLFALIEPSILFDNMARDNYKLLQLAITKDSKLTIIEKLLPASSPAVSNALAVNNFQLLTAAATHSNIVVFDYFYSLLEPEDIGLMIVADDFHIFRQAAARGHHKIIQLFMEQADPDTQKTMFAADNFSVFRSAVRCGDHALFDLAFNVIGDPVQQDEMLRHGFQEGFSEFPSGNRLNIMKRLVECAPHHINLLRMEECMPWWYTGSETLRFLHHLIELLSAQLPTFLASRQATETLPELSISLPDTNLRYHYSCDKLTDGGLTISFGGGSKPVRIDVNVDTLNWVAKINPHGFHPITFESKETLPLDFLTSKIPLFVYDHKQGELQAVSQLHVFNRDIIVPKTTEHAYDSRLEIINHELQQACQTLVPNVLVKVGRHPIFQVKNRPNFEWLTKLYDGFWRYNEDRIRSQYAMTQSRCHIRAHFVSTLLRCYGIDSLKVFKFWDNPSVEVYGSEERWGFHCAVMIIDSENRKWVWDPWVGANSRLLSLDEWVHDKKAPLPSELVIHNRGVLSIVIASRQWGRIPNLAFDCKVAAGFRTFFQVLCADAIPNPPEKAPALGRNTWHFFHSPQQAVAPQGNEERRVVLYQGSALV